MSRLSMVYFLALLLFHYDWIVDATAVASKVHSDPNIAMFVDTKDGRIRMLYGLSFVNKIDDVVYVSDEDMDVFSRDWGLNTARVGFLWNLLEPSPGVYNMTYLNALENLVDRFGARGIYVILDMHQDLWSPYTCGQGLPSFYARPYNQSEYTVDGKWTFPRPIVPPQYAANHSESDPFPRITNCNEVFKGPFGWASGYFTYALGAASQRLYDNDAGIRDRFGDMWQLIANRFAPKAYVIGYELLNEPWLGDVPLSWDQAKSLRKWLNWMPSFSERNNLEPLYEYLYDRISVEDNDTMLFFQPATGGNLIGSFPVGFSQGPGGPTNRRRQALSYHIYCPLVESDSPINIPATWPKWLRDFLNGVVLGACRDLNDRQFSIRVSDAKRLRVASLMTEFGAIPDSTDGYVEVQAYMDQMDKYMQGWLYWGITNVSQNLLLCPGTVYCITGQDLIDADQPLAHLLARPKVLAVAGVPQQIKFDNSSNRFQLSFMPFDDDIDKFSLPTEIFINTTDYYPTGYNLSVSTDNVTAGFDTNRNVLSVQLDRKLFRLLKIVEISIVPNTTFLSKTVPPQVNAVISDIVIEANDIFAAVQVQEMLL